MTEPSGVDLTLDPEDWDALEATALQATRDAVQFLRTVRETPTWQPLPADVRDRLLEPLPRRPRPLQEVYEQAQKDIMPYRTGNLHPRFWGWVMGTGTVDGLVADIMASAMNAHVGGYDQSASLVERQVVAWMASAFGYGPQAKGVMVSGGTSANITGMVVARQAKAGFDVRAEGISGRPPMTVYGSDQTHSWIQKSCELMGMGRRAFRAVPSGPDHRIDMEALGRMVDQDRRFGLHPICVIGNAGTVNAGAIDPMDLLADFCAAQDLWLHVDGALGGLAVLSPVLAPRLKGIERADSIAFDLHKWGYLQYEIGCILVKDGTRQQDAFAATADYLEPNGRGIQPDALEFAQLGLQLSRGFRALKAWVAFKTHGADAIGAVIEQNVAHVQYFVGRVRTHPLLELLGPADLNVACFRYVEPGMDGETLNALNREILLRIQETGIAIPSSTMVKGQFAIRIANSNHRTRREDFDTLLGAVLRIGREASAS